MSCPLHVPGTPTRSIKIDLETQEVFDDQGQKIGVVHDTVMSVESDVHDIQVIGQPGPVGQVVLKSCVEAEFRMTLHNPTPQTSKKVTPKKPARKKRKPVDFMVEDEGVDLEEEFS